MCSALFCLALLACVGLVCSNFPLHSGVRVFGSFCLNDPSAALPCFIDKV